MLLGSGQWKIENERNIKEYIVEKSLDGEHFTATGTIIPKNNDGQSANYVWIDTDPVAGNNYYRIRSATITNEIEYSVVTKVTTENRNPQIVIHPNPIIEGTVNLKFINQPKGLYNVRLLNTVGQVILSKQIQHEQGSNIYNIQINKITNSGSYLLEITGVAKFKTTLKVLR